MDDMISRAKALAECDGPFGVAARGLIERLPGATGAELVRAVRRAYEQGEIYVYTEQGDAYVEDVATGERAAIDRCRRGGAAVTRRECEEEGPFRGFLLVRCAECGTVRAFCAKHETWTFRCKACGEETLLEDLKPAHLHCTCGKNFTYQTNLREENIAHTCIACGAKTTMVLNKRRTAYVTERTERREAP